MLASPRPQVMLFFSLGPGPLTFVVINEMLPLRLRARVVALAVFFNRLGSGTIALTFLSLKEAIGVVAAFSVYGSLGLAITLFYARCVPDMTGVSLEESPTEASAESTDEAESEAPDGRNGLGESSGQDLLPGRMTRSHAAEASSDVI